MNRTARFAAMLVGALALTLTLPFAPDAARGAEETEWEVSERSRRSEELLQHAMDGQEPTPEEQRLAQQLLRDWRLSERHRPSGDQRTGAMLQTLAEGRPLPNELARKAEEMHRQYFTEQGRQARQRGASGSSGYGPAAGAKTAAGDWFMLVVSLLILVGGVAVSALARYRKRPDRDAYYQ